MRFGAGVCCKEEKSTLDLRRQRGNATFTVGKATRPVPKCLKPQVPESPHVAVDAATDGWDYTGCRTRCELSGTSCTSLKFTSHPFVYSWRTQTSQSPSSGILSWSALCRYVGPFSAPLSSGAEEMRGQHTIPENWRNRYAIPVSPRSPCLTHSPFRWLLADPGHRTMRTPLVMLILCLPLWVGEAQTATAPYQLSGGFSALSNSFNGVPGSRQPLLGWDVPPSPHGIISASSSITPTTRAQTWDRPSTATSPPLGANIATALAARASSARCSSAKAG